MVTRVPESCGRRVDQCVGIPKDFTRIVKDSKDFRPPNEVENRTRIGSGKNCDRKIGDRNMLARGLDSCG